MGMDDVKLCVAIGGWVDPAPLLTVRRIPKRTIEGIGAIRSTGDLPFDLKKLRTPFPIPSWYSTTLLHAQCLQSSYRDRNTHSLFSR